MAEASVLIGGGSAPAELLLQYANRHGLVAGATGTGKTITVQGLAESFSAAGVPVIVADVKGDLAGIAMPGTASERVAARWAQIGRPQPPFAGAPARIWDVHGEAGVALRLSISELGPQMLARMLELNETQEAALSLVFRFADEQGLLLLDLDDLTSTLVHLADNQKALGARYAAFSKPSVAAIQRRLLLLEQAGARTFFGEPAVQLQDLMQQAPDGRGVVNLLDARRLVSQPRLYASFLLWLLSELFEALPEAGDLERPKLVFFFDEAHLLFDDAPKALRERIEQVVRLIRSRGVGVWFISQSPADIPDEVLAQLGNRVQHALRAYTPGEQKAVRAAAEAFRPNPAFDTRQAIGELAVGEALVSTLGAGGVPSVVERVLVRPPCSRMGPLTEPERAALLAADPLFARYREARDPVSAHEILTERARAAVQQPLPEAPARERPEPRQAAPRGRQRQTATEALVSSVARSVGSSLGRSIVRGLLGSILRGR